MSTPETPAPDLLARFGPMTVGERAACQAAWTGVVATAPPNYGHAHPDVQVRAELVRFLAMNGDPARKLHERGLGLGGMRIHGSLELSGCAISSPLRFLDCHLDEIDFTGATLSTFSLIGGRSGRIHGDRCLAAAIFVRDCYVSGGMRLLGAALAGDLDCSRSQLFAAAHLGMRGFDPTDQTTALGLDGATIKGAVFLRGTAIQGAVLANSVVVGKVFDARGLFICSGHLALGSALLGGDLLLRGSAIRTSPPYARALYAEALVLDAARIAGSLQLSMLFQADGPINLNSAQVGGNFSIRGARLMGHAQFAIYAHALNVEGAFELDSTTCFGPDACARAPVAVDGDDPATVLAPATLEQRRAALAGGQPWSPGAALDLTSATVGSLSDQWALWPARSRILAFRFKSLGVFTFTQARWWIRWLANSASEIDGVHSEPGPRLGTEEFRPQAWDQVIAALRASGCERDAIGVSIAKQRAEYALDLSWLTPLRFLWGLCAGYGYRPLRLLWALPIVFGISGAVYLQAADAGAMAPTKEDFLAKAEYQHCKPENGGNWTRCALAPAYPDFNAWAYAAQMMLPAIELRQAKDWAPVEWVRPDDRSAKKAVVAAAPASHGVAPASFTSSAVVAVAIAEPKVEPMPAVSTWGRRALFWSWIEATLGLAAPILVGLAWSGLIERRKKD